MNPCSCVGRSISFSFSPKSGLREHKQIIFCSQNDVLCNVYASWSRNDVTPDNCNAYEHNETGLEYFLLRFRLDGYVHDFKTLVSCMKMFLYKQKPYSEKCVQTTIGREQMYILCKWRAKKWASPDNLRSVLSHIATTFLYIFISTIQHPSSFLKRFFTFMHRIDVLVYVCCALSNHYLLTTYNSNYIIYLWIVRPRVQQSITP